MLEWIIMFFLTVWLFVSPVMAEGNDEEMSWQEVCSLNAELAEVIMRARQAGVPMSQIMDAFGGDGNQIARAMTLAAYDSFRYHTENSKRRAVEDFRDEWYLKCVRDMMPQ